MKVLFAIVVLCFTFSTFSFGQLGSHDVLQTQMGNDLNSFKVIEGNPILAKVVHKRKGLEFHRTAGDKSFLSWDDIEMVNFGHNEYHFDVQLDDMSISLLYKPYPYQTSEQRLQTGTISIKGYEKEYPEATSYFKLIFLDELVLN